MGVKESDTGLAAPNLWDIQADKVGFWHALLGVLFVWGLWGLVWDGEGVGEG